MQEETPAENELAALKKNCGLKIAKARDKLGLSQYSFADKIGISRNSLREIENGNTLPRMQTIAAICQITGLKSDDLIQTNASEKSPPASSTVSEEIPPLPSNPEKRQLCKQMFAAVLSVINNFDM